jgi:hypothetical protein
MSTTIVSIFFLTFAFFFISQDDDEMMGDFDGMGMGDEF